MAPISISPEEEIQKVSISGQGLSLLSEEVILVNMMSRGKKTLMPP